MKIGDKIIIFFAAVLSLSSLLFLYMPQQKDDSKYVIIKVDGREEKRVTFDNTTDSLYDFSFAKGIGTIEIKNGRVRMKEMDESICPNRVCSLTGWISTTRQAIVCMPNKILIRIGEREKNQETVDVVSF